jgi:hypothetical protein
MSEEIKKTLSPLSNFKITTLSIFTNENLEIDLVNNFIEVNLYESVFSPVVLGDIIVVEQFNFPSLGTIVGGERIKIKIENIYTSIYKTSYEFVVYSIKERTIIQQKSQMYAIKFCSKEAFWNQQSRICTTYYNQTCSYIASLIFSSLQAESSLFSKETKKNMSAFEAMKSTDEVDFKVLISSGKKENPVTIHFPNLHPFEAISFLMGRAKTEKKGNPYFFFERISRAFYFRSWEELIEKNNRNKEGIIPKDLKADFKKYDKNSLFIINSAASINLAENANQDPNLKKEFFHDEVDFFNATAFHFPKDFDYFENVKKGIYSSQLITFDNTRKKIKKFRYSQKHHYDKIPHIVSGLKNALNSFQEEKSEFMSDLYDESFIRAIPNASSLFQNEKEDYFPDFTKNSRILKLQELNNNIVTTNIPGNLSVECGNFADVFLCSPDTTIADQVKADPHFSGVYFILRVRHCFKVGGEFISSVELAKDSFMEETFKDNLTPPKK